MDAGIRVGDAITVGFEVRNSLQRELQCMMAPTLCNLYFNTVATVWHEQWEYLCCINMV